MGETAHAELEQRANAGEPDAQFQFGLLLLEGPRAMVDGRRGITLIDSAFGKGHADAGAMCALFEAMGADRPQSWPLALDRLAEAAELGSESAQGQLQVLAGEIASGDTSPRDWRSMRAAISVEQLLQPPSRQVLSDAPRIVSFTRFARPAECGWVIARAGDRLQRAKVFDTGTGGQTCKAVRNNSAIEFQLPQMDLVLEILRARIASATRLPVPLFEPTQVLHYSVGEQFRPHHDFLDPAIPGFAEQLRLYGQRIGTFLIYLNDAYTGGETRFPKVGISYRGDAGDALFFANVDRQGNADRLTMHSGAPPTAGEKWVISQWIRDRAPGSPADDRQPAK